MNDKRSTWLSGWRLVLVVYLLLLVASHIWRALNPDRHEPDSGQKTVTLRQVYQDSVIDNRSLKIAYRDVYHGERQNPPVVLLLHGSPVGVPMLPDLIDALARKNRVVAPDFPGYEASDREIPDYSMKAYSVYMDQLLDTLGVNRAHVVGYSMGGGVAIYLSHLHPEKVASIVMLSGLGVQELELLGSYNLNHAVHGVQLALIWLLHEAVPHFGLLSDFPLSVPYARSFYDSDQRPLRGYLNAYKKPMLIQHGREDGLIPLIAAREHHRIVPQSEMILYDGGHGIVISKASTVARDISEFVQDVETGIAKTYADAGKRRIREARKPFDNVDFAKAEGITLFVLMLIIIFSTLISEDLTCVGAGLLAARGIIGFWPATVACFIGIFIGDVGLYLIGRWLGRPAVRRAPVKWFLTEKDLKQSADWFRAKGPAIIIASRFIPGSRLPTYFSAGVIGAGFWMFIFYFILAAVVWTPLLVGGTMLIGTELLRYFELYQDYAVWILLATVLLLFLFVKFILPAFTWRGRRLIVSRWRRLTRWEYWSPYIIYAPVILFIVRMWIKYGRLTLFTAANPGIEYGGFIDESKSAILKQLVSNGAVPPFIKIEGGLSSWEKFLKARSFIDENQIGYPIVVKPDAGQRGTGVHIPKNEEQLKTVLQDNGRDLILQQYVEGDEFGIFYYRYPGEGRGRILSITEKQLPILTGDGKKTLEELILEDGEAVSLAKKHLRNHKDHIYRVPAEGKKIRLVELGTHARGAQFRDGGYLKTPRLEEAVDDLVSHFDGFYFGRLDVRTPDKEHLQRGEGITILEVNGVTSEDTSIYDSYNSFIEAQKKLFEQWRLAFEIGDLNRREGAEVASVFSLIKKIITYIYKTR